MLDLTINRDGHLNISIDQDGLDHLEDYKDERSHDALWAELTEDTACNGSFTYFNAGDANPFVGLSSAPCIAEALDFDDDGNAEIQGRFWYFEPYMIHDELDALYKGETVTFNLAS